MARARYVCGAGPRVHPGAHRETSVLAYSESSGNEGRQNIEMRDDAGVQEEQANEDTSNHTENVTSATSISHPRQPCH